MMFRVNKDKFRDVSLTFLLELLHVGGGHWRAKELQQLHLRHVLVILKVEVSIYSETVN